MIFHNSSVNNAIVHVYDKNNNVAWLKRIIGRGSAEFKSDKSDEKFDARVFIITQDITAPIDYWIKNVGVRNSIQIPK